MQTLKEILIDAARYRWVRDNPYTFCDFVDQNRIISESHAKDCDEYIDNRLRIEND